MCPNKAKAIALTWLTTAVFKVMLLRNNNNTRHVVMCTLFSANNLSQNLLFLDSVYSIPNLCRV